MYTPWGQADKQTKLAEGIIDCSTPSHGGIWLSPERQAKIPTGTRNFLNSLEWWEEDCDWSVPYVLFADDIRAGGKAYHFEENLETAKNILKRYHPEVKNVGGILPCVK
jgi:hypothetical protein